MAVEKSHEAISALVAKFLREERERRGLSMNVVAARSGLSQQMVSYVERGMRNPTLETLLRMTAAIGVELATIIDRAARAAKRK